MSLIDRAKNMIVTPKTEWDVVAGEGTAPAQVVTGYVLPLAAAYAVASFLGMAIVMGMLGGALGIGASLVAAIWNLVMAVVMVFVLAFLIDALAPTFGGTKSFNQAVKVAAYSYTPVWVFGLLTIIPVLGWLAVLVGSLYALYLLYLGLPRVMRAPEEKAVPYVVVIIVAAIVLSLVLGMIGGLLGGMGGMGYRGAMGAAVQSDARMAKLDEMGRKMEEASKRMEAAQKSGDPAKQMEAAMGALGTALSGGKSVEPVQLDALKPMLPQTFAGLPLKGQDADRSGVAGLMAAKVGGEYADDANTKSARLQITDTGGAAGLMGLAAWAAVGAASEREDDSRVERMKREGTRLVREEVSKRGGTNHYSVILADRFVVQADGNVDIAALKAGVNGLDLAKIESLK